MELECCRVVENESCDSVCSPFRRYWQWLDALGDVQVTLFLVEMGEMGWRRDEASPGRRSSDGATAAVRTQ